MKKIFLILCVGIGSAVFTSAGEFSPWDAWRNGHTYFEKGTQARDRADYVYALELFQRAEREYERVRKARPDWNQKIIQGRLDDCRRELEVVRKLLGGGDSATGMRDVSASGNAFSADPVEMQALRREAAEYKQKYFEALAELDELRRKVQQGDNAAEEVANLLREQRVMDEKYRLLEKRYHDLEQQALEPDSRLDTLQKQLVEEKLNTDLITKRLQVAEARIRKQDQDAIELYRQKSAAESRAGSAAEELERVRSELTELRRFQDEAVVQRGELQKELDRGSLLIKEYESKLVNREAELASLRSRLEGTLKDGGDSAALNADLLKENRELREALTSARGAAATAQEESTQLQARQRDLQLELVRARETSGKIEEARARLEQENSAFRRDLEREKGAGELSKLELKNLRERNLKLEGDMQEWADRCARLEQRLESRSSEDIRNLTAADAARKKLASELEQLKLESAGYRSRIEELTGQNTRYEQENQDAQQKLQKLEAARRQLENDLAAARLNQEKLAKLAPELRQLRQNFAALQTENTANRKQLEELKEARTALDAAREQLAGVEKLRNQLAAVQKENQQLAEQARKLEAELKARPVVANVEKLPVAPTDGKAGVLQPVQVGSPAELMAAGRKAEAEESFDLAIWNYKTALELAPDLPEAQARLGLIFLRREEFEKALPLLEAVRLKQPEDPELAAADAEALIGVEKYGNALAAVEKPLTKHPGDLRLLMAAGRALAGSGQAKTARETFEKAAELHPEAAAPRLELARLVLRNSPQNEQEAAGFYQAARSLGAAPDLELEPRLGKLLSEHREVNEFMASAALEAEKNGDWTSAAWYYRQMLELDREAAGCAARLAFAEYKLGHTPAALEILAMNRPSSLGALVALLIHFQENDFSAALEAAEQAAASGPELLSRPELGALADALRQAIAGRDAQRSVAAKECAGKLLEKIPALRDSARSQH